MVGSPSVLCAAGGAGDPNGSEDRVLARPGGRGRRVVRLRGRGLRVLDAGRRDGLHGLASRTVPPVLPIHGDGPGGSLPGDGAAHAAALETGENATLNPRDADAHFQLGLTYVQRRQYESAIECFRKAIDIDPGEADAHYQLGRVAREPGRYRDAIEHRRTAARIDDKHSLSELWREIGIAELLAGNREDSRRTLEKYLERRPYDPEGNCWYGRAMAAHGHWQEARAAFEQAIESVRTMPPARKR